MHVNSDSKYYTVAELQGLSKEQLRLARNEIFAKKGAIFKSADLQEYFVSRYWYNPVKNAADFTDADFNMYELANIKLIQSLE